jgi:AraC-like DNA-binding protein
LTAHDHLTLRLHRIRPDEEWACGDQELSFISVNGGVGRFVAGTVIYPLVQGDWVVVNSAVGGILSPCGRTELVLQCFSVCFEHLFPLFAGSEISLLQGVMEGFKGIKVFPAASALARECQLILRAVPPQFDLDHRCQLLRIVAAALSAEFKNARRQRSGYVRVEEHLMQVFEKLSVPELLTLSVGEMASKFSCSRRHLNRLFHQYFGVSVAALRMEMRLLKAVSLLRDPNVKIISVAEQCGFNHLGLFNTCFKKRLGQSPGQWRKRTVPNGDRLGGLSGLGPICPMRINGLCPGTAYSEHDTVASPPPPRTSVSGPARAPVVVEGIRKPTDLRIFDGNQQINEGNGTRVLPADH